MIRPFVCKIKSLAELVALTIPTALTIIRAFLVCLIFSLPLRANRQSRLAQRGIFFPTGNPFQES